MRGLDGNYLNTQGDATARMQVAYQAEQNRQQIKAQLEATDALRKLREEVNETEKMDSSLGPKVVNEDQGSRSGAFRDEEESGQKPRKNLAESNDDQSGQVSPGRAHIDIRA